VSEVSKNLSEKSSFFSLRIGELLVRIFLNFLLGRGMFVFFICLGINLSDISIEVNLLTLPTFVCQIFGSC
jgi:hypothetical protein